MLTEDLVLVLSLTHIVTHNLSLTSVPGNQTHSPDLLRHQAHTWLTYIQAGNHTPKNTKLKIKQTYGDLSLQFCENVKNEN